MEYRFTFRLTYEDIEAVNLHVMARDPALWRGVLRWNLLLPAALLAVGMALTLAFGWPWPVFLGFCLAALALLLAFPALFRRRRERLLRASLARLSRDNPLAVQGPVDCAFDEEGFTLRREETSETRYSYAAIQRAAWHGEYLCLSMERGAVILPGRAFSGPDERQAFQAFIADRAPTPETL